MDEQTTAPRIILDISTACRWSGEATGIVRVEREYAIWARRNLQDVEFVLYDTNVQAYRIIQDQWIEPILHGECTLDNRSLPEPTSTRRHFLDRVPSALRSSMLWMLHFRRQLLLALEFHRLQTSQEPLAHILGHVQRQLMNAKYRQLMVRPDGTRRPFLQLRMMLGEPMLAVASDTLVSVGSGWSHINVAAIAKLKKQRGFRFAILCHDIIPLLSPQFFKPHDIEDFRAYFHVAFQAADLVMFSTRKVESDARSYCAEHGLKLGRTCITPFGANAVTSRSDPGQIDHLGIEPQKYVLFVGTIEPRKGHRFLLGVWRRLLDAGIPQRQGFKLVLVGRPGWLVDDLLAEIDREATKSGSVTVLSNADDRTLAALYEAAAFCAYPSEHEGYGLPIVEAFLRGKAVIASTGGAIPEVVAGFSPCLDPHDAAAWYDTLQRWILDPTARRPFEEDIRSRFRRTTWDDAAAAFFKTVSSLAPEKGRS